MSLEENIKKHLFDRNNKCSWTVLYEQLSEADKKVIDNALANNYATVTIIAALRDEGYRMGEPTLNQHRRQKCRCRNAK
jgi:hypothetical protein